MQDVSVLMILDDTPEVMAVRVWGAWVEPTYNLSVAQPGLPLIGISPVTATKSDVQGVASHRQGSQCMRTSRSHRHARRDVRCIPASWLGTLIAIIVLTGPRGVVAGEWLYPPVTNAASSQPADLGQTSPWSLSAPWSSAEVARGTAHEVSPPATSVVAASWQAGESDALEGLSGDAALQPLPSWFNNVRVGYDNGFVIASDRNLRLDASELPYLLRFNGWGQLRHSYFDSEGVTDDLNQFQLIRGRLVFSGNAFTPDLRYFVQLDGRSSAGDEFRLLDYVFNFDVGRHYWGLDRNALVFKVGKYKIPFTFARELSAHEFQFADRSMASMFFDVNRSLAWGLAGQYEPSGMPLGWEIGLFNGLVTGGEETGSSGSLDNNFAYSARIFAFPTGDWGAGSLADFDWHDSLATRVGAAFAGSTIDRMGITEFNSIRVVDSGDRLSTLLPASISEYSVNTYCVDASCKYRGWSVTSEYYFRYVDGFQGGSVPALFDHGFWLQAGKFLVPRKLELLSRWSRVVGSSGTLGRENQSADEIAGGFAWYFRDQQAKLTCDVTHVNGAPISSSALDMFPGDIGWLFRTQIQFAF